MNKNQKLKIFAEKYIKNNDLIHVGNSPKILKEKMNYEQKKCFKPTGLWYSYGSEWIDWIYYEMPSFVENYIFKLTICEKNLLRISSKNIVDFDDWDVNWEKYNKSVFDFPNYKRILTENLWYSTIDVSSGCITKKDGLVSCKLIGKWCDAKKDYIFCENTRKRKIKVINGL